MLNTNDGDITDLGLQKISEAAKFLGLSRSYIYKLIEAGNLPSAKIGKSRRVPIRAIQELARNSMKPGPDKDSENRK